MRASNDQTQIERTVEVYDSTKIKSRSVRGEVEMVHNESIVSDPELHFRFLKVRIGELNRLQSFLDSGQNGMGW